MAEKRQYRRFKRRLLVKYGVNDLSMSGFTGDVSTGGLFVAAARPLPLDTRLHVQLFLDPTRFLFFEGEVRRQKVTPRELSGLEPTGFGIRFLHPREVVLQALGRTDHLEVHYATVSALREAYQRELKHGALFVPASKGLPRNTEVNVGLCLDFVNKDFELQATVVHVAEEGPNRGVGVVFKDRGALEAALKPFLKP